MIAALHTVYPILLSGEYVVTVRRYTSGSMSGRGERSVAAWPKLPRPSSTLPSRLLPPMHLRVEFMSGFGSFRR
jgi:hypothetical protein